MADEMRIEVTRSVPDEFWHGAVRMFFESVMFAGHRHLAQPGVVPIDKGKLRDSLSPGAGGTYVDKANPPKFARVGPPAGSEVARYAGALDDPKARDPHYRDGPSRGKPTRGWISNAPAAIEGEVRALVAELARELEGAWKRG